MNCTVTLFYDTTFDSVNIPDSPALLKEFRSKQFNSVWVKQDREIIEIKIEGKWDDVKNADYCSLKGENTTDIEQFYFVTAMNMLNDNVCRMTLVEDVINSVGGIQNINFIDGWAKRLSVGSDELFENIIEEPFTNSQELVTETYPLAQFGAYENSVTIVAATINLASESLNKADVYVNTEDESFKVTVPRVNEIPALETKLTLTMPNGELLTVSYPGVFLFDYSNALVKNNIEKIRSLGLESTIIGCYRLPKSYIKNFSTDENGAQIIDLLGEQINNLGIVTEDGNLGFTYNYPDYTPNNKKVYSQFNEFTFFSQTSGEQMTVPGSGLYNGVVQIPTVDIIVNPGPGGFPILRPSYVKKQKTDKNNFTINSINGAIWAEAPLTFSAASGDAVTRAAMAITKSQALADWDYNFSAEKIWSNRLKDLGGLVGGSTSALPGSSATERQGALVTTKGYNLDSLKQGGNIISSMLKTSGDVVDYDPARDREYARANMRRNMARERLQYEQVLNLTGVDITFNAAPDLQIFLGNIFCVMTNRLSEKDLKRFDDFLTRFGYSVSEELTKDKLFTRNNFNYVQADSVEVTGNSDLTRRRQIAISEIFETGIRIWHVKPSREALKNNPIKEVN